jgi:hypothetical protein
MAKGVKTGGRVAGTVNKATAQARQAIASFVDGNAHRLQGWLDQIAAGVQDEDGAFIVQPNPEKAFTLFQSVIEYHVPKLARSEITGEDGGPVVIQASNHDEKL